MRACIFCTLPATSKEHVFAEWLHSVLDDVRDIVAPGRTPVVRHERGDEPMRTWIDLRNLRVRHVCEECNNGWMSELENCAKPILTPLILGKPCVLNRLDQFTLASWAIKTAMVFEATRVSGRSFYTPEERRHLLDTSVPPPRTSVWLAQYRGDLGAYCKAEDLDSHVDGSFHRLDFYVTTMSFGRLVVQVSSGHIPRSVGAAQTMWVDQSRGPWDAAARRIWPVTDSVSWPPRVSLFDAEPSLEGFASRWLP